MWDGFTFAFRKETMIIGKGGGVIYQHSKRFSVRQGPHYTATGNQPQEPLNQQTTNGRIGGHGEVAPPGAWQTRFSRDEKRSKIYP